MTPLSPAELLHLQKVTEDDPSKYVLNMSNEDLLGAAHWSCSLPSNVVDISGEDIEEFEHTYAADAMAAVNASQDLMVLSPFIAMSEIMSAAYDAGVCY